MQTVGYSIEQITRAHYTVGPLDGVQHGGAVCGAECSMCPAVAGRSQPVRTNTKGCFCKWLLEVDLASSLRGSHAVGP